MHEEQASAEGADEHALPWRERLAQIDAHTIPLALDDHLGHAGCDEALRGAPVDADARDEVGDLCDGRGAIRRRGRGLRVEIEDDAIDAEFK